MPVYHFIYHAYRSWNADHKDGWHQHGELGSIDAAPGIASYRDEIAKHPPMHFTNEQQQQLLEILFDVTGNHAIRPHCIGMDLTHVHAVVSWKDGRTMEEVRDRIKNLMSMLLNKKEHALGRRVFSHGSGDTQILGNPHLNHLKNDYLPNHSGLFWCEP